MLLESEISPSNEAELLHLQPRRSDLGTKRNQLEILLQKNSFADIQKHKLIIPSTDRHGTCYSRAELTMACLVNTENKDTIFC